MLTKAIFTCRHGHRSEHSVDDVRWGQLECSTCQTFIDPSDHEIQEATVQWIFEITEHLSLETRS